MSKRKPTNRDSGSVSVWPVLCLLILLGRATGATAAEGEAPAPAAVHDMSSILGPGSQLQAAPDGEFNFTFGDEGFDTFRAVKDVVVTTEDIDCRCDELVYIRVQGTLTATTKPPGRVRIKMHSMNPSAAGSDKKGDTYATCRRYQYFIDDKRHELTLDPIVIRTDEKGKETAISGDRIILTQDKSGRWNMHVKGNPQIYDPKEKDKLDKVRKNLGGSKPTVNVDAPNRTGTSAPPPVASGGATTPKSPKIDEGNVQDLKPRKPSRVVKLEEGG